MPKKLFLSLCLSVLFFFGGANSALAAPSSLNCGDQREVNTQFRMSGTAQWISGGDLTVALPRVGQQVDVNCFAKDGTTLLQNAVIELKLPNSEVQRVANGPELRNFTLPRTGRYTFTCASTTVKWWNIVVIDLFSSC